MIKVWLDDIRKPPDDGSVWIWYKTNRECIQFLLNNPCDLLSLDHDLGGSETSRKTVLRLCETGKWPKRVIVHSSNPPGREWLEGMIERYQQ